MNIISLLIEEVRKMALDRVTTDPSVTHQQRLTLTMSVRNLLESFEDKERVSKIQGLINEMMTFMGDEMALITGPYDELLSLDEVIDQKLILYLSLNVNVNERAVTALGRMLLQNLQLMIGRRYSRAEEGGEQPFVSVIMDEFSPFAYENFAHILQTARGANVAFLFALQSAPQLLQVGRGFRNDVSSAPNTTFMLRTKDEETAKYFLNASAPGASDAPQYANQEERVVQPGLRRRNRRQPNRDQGHACPGRTHQENAGRPDGNAGD
jgi:type IV secretory pathway TraG/TraD family ATPase VirD4